MDVSAVLQEQHERSAAVLRSPRSTKIFGIALVLWIASNVFVTGIAKITTWESTASYHRMANLCRWDCTWYASVIKPGYVSAPTTADGSTNWAFNPLFPITAYPLHKWLRLSLFGSLVLASKVELLLAIYAFILMFADEMKTTAQLVRAGSLVAFNPYVIYAHAGYAEPLYFALIALGFYFANRKRWILAGLAGGFASAARVVGAVFAAPYFVAWLRARGWRSDWSKRDLNGLIGLLLCPLGSALLMLYLYHHTGDALSLQHAHVAWGRDLANPFPALWWNLRETQWSRVWAIMMVAAWLTCGWLFKLRKPELAIYLALALSLTFLTPIVGYLGVARYIWWQPPFLYGIYRALRNSDAAWVLYIAFASGMAAFMVIGWFGGHNFVV